VPSRRASISGHDTARPSHHAVTAALPSPASIPVSLSAFALSGLGRKEDEKSKETKRGTGQNQGRPGQRKRPRKVKPAWARNWKGKRRKKTWAFDQIKAQVKDQAQLLSTPEFPNFNEKTANLIRSFAESMSFSFSQTLFNFMLCEFICLICILNI
jgi:hypothetical protein